MSWLIEFLTSSIGKKLVMSLSGLFLILFLLVHLVGNLQLFYNDEGVSFNVYAHFMTTNPLVKFLSIGLYATILLHAVQGILIAWKNKQAKGSKYAVTTYANGTWMAKNMALLGTLIFAFLCIHMGDFWWKMKFTDSMVPVTYEGYDYQVKDLYTRVMTAFKVWWIVAAYIIGLIALALPLLHGFASAFNTLGLAHKKYTPLIMLIGWSYAILVPLGFAAIPLYVFFRNLWNY